MHKQQKIRVMCRGTQDGFHYSILDWEEYLAARRARGLPEPEGRFTFTIGFELKPGFEARHGRFDEHIPLFYELPAEAIEIVSAERLARVHGGGGAPGSRGDPRLG